MIPVKINMEFCSKESEDSLEYFTIDAIELCDRASTRSSSCLIHCRSETLGRFCVRGHIFHQNINDGVFIWHPRYNV